MKNELETRQILNVYEKIVEHGQRNELGHQLEGITAFTDHDGYTVYLEGHNTKLQTGFHNTYNLDYSTQRDADLFLKKLKYIDQEYN
ncbi:DUF3081 domain-containing protein [Aliidiomarina sedimenti]|uniref:DUF3081 domain-containing protein n=2 Tax=Aliidiomarina TaxID=1249554 RepID=A0A432WF55_9GAMM|nr:MULTISPECIES: DUF3081 family protein [Aliidiomarina]RUO29212.1 DUF3081 domain-containing protein [Aliidiomarina sedimenti]RUO32394.1 DUF3081 domain-containing protein [Aliidiomarina soli]